MIVSDGTTNLAVSRGILNIILAEQDTWEAAYRPPFSLRGATVLDVGAGCGESAAFFFECGAERVIAIEADSRASFLLKQNANWNNWKIEIHQTRFSSSQLEIPHRFMKMDIEGGEIELLRNGVTSLGPCRIELHPTLIGESNCSAIIRKFGLNPLPGGTVWGRDS